MPKRPGTRNNTSNPEDESISVERLLKQVRIGLICILPHKTHAEQLNLF